MDSKRLKILHLFPVFNVGGAEMLVLQYFNFLDPQRFDVYVASTVEDGALREKFLDASRVFVVSRRAHGGRLGAWRVLKKYVDQLQPDIIHTHIVSADFFGFLLKRRYGNKVKWISTQHNVEHHSPWLDRAVLRTVLPYADRVIAVSPVVHKYVVAGLGVSAHAVTTVLNGITLAPWQSVPPVTISTSQPLRLATIGRLEKQKGHAILFSALAALHDVSWQLTVFGAGRELANLKNLAKRLGIEEQITWAGVALDLPKRLEAVDVVVQPSLWEGLSLTVMESMAAGRPVIASEVAGAGLITNGVTGWCVPTGDSGALASALRKVMSEPAGIVSVGNAAKEYALNRFGLENHLGQIAKIYSEVYAKS